MKVWILEKGAYSDRFVSGVYLTAELAMSKNHPGGSGQWTQSADGTRWDNGADFDTEMEICEYEVIE